MLRAPGDRRLDLGLAQVGGDVVDDLRQVHVARGARARRPAGRSRRSRLGYRVANARSSSSHLMVFMPSRWASGAKISSVSRAFRSCLCRRQVAQRPHVVQPVGELDHQHPDVAGHRDDHLADGLGLRRLAVLDLVELGDAVDQRGDLLAEVAAQLVEGVVGVLDRVVQQRGDERRRGSCPARRGSWPRRADG